MGARENRGTGGGRGKSGRLELLRGGGGVEIRGKYANREIKIHIHRKRQTSD